MESPLFRSKPPQILATGPDQTAIGADSSPESGGNQTAMQRPVWETFVTNTVAVENNREAVQAERDAQRNASLLQREQRRASMGTYRGSNGKLLYKAPGQRAQLLDPEQYADHPEAGPEARKSLWSKEIRSNREQAQTIGLQLSNPEFHAKGLSKKDREAIEAEGSMLQESDPRHVELKKRLMDDDEYQRTKAELAQEAWNRRNRAQELENTDPDSWWQSRGQQPQPTATEQRQTKVADIQTRAAEADGVDQAAASRETELRNKLRTGVSGTEIEAVKAELKSIAEHRAAIAGVKAGAEREIGGVQAEAKQEVDKPFFGFSDVFSGIWDAVKGLGVTAPAAFYQLTEGLERPDKYSDAAKAAFAEADAYTQSMQAKNAEAGATDVGSAFRDTGGSLGFSLGSMAAAIPASMAGAKVGAATGGAIGAMVGSPAAGVGAVPAGGAGAAIGGTIGGISAGMAASGASAYRMAGASFLNEAFQTLNAESVRKNGRPMNEQEMASAYENLLPIAQNTALWEAGPEAVGNAVTLGAGKIVFGLGKPLMARFMATTGGKIATKAGAVAASVGTELGTETLTQVEQGADQQKMQALATGQDPNAIKADWSTSGVSEAFREIAPQTLALMVLMGGAGGAIKTGAMAVDKLRGKTLAEVTPEERASIVEEVNTGLAAIDPEATPATADEVADAVFMSRDDDGPDGMADLVLLNRDLADIDATQSADRDQRAAAIQIDLDAAVQNGAKESTIKQLRTNLEELGATGSPASLVRAALKIAAGKDLTDLTDDELIAVGYESKPGKDGTINFKPISEPSKGNGKATTAPAMIRAGEDGSIILTDTALKKVGEVSERARKRIAMSESEAIAKAKQRAAQQVSTDTPNGGQGDPATGFPAGADGSPIETKGAVEFDVPTQSGRIIRVQAASGPEAEVMAREIADLGDMVANDSAVPVSTPTSQPNLNESQIENNPTESQATQTNALVNQPPATSAADSQGSGGNDSTVPRQRGTTKTGEVPGDSTNPTTATTDTGTRSGGQSGVEKSTAGTNQPESSNQSGGQGAVRGGNAEISKPLTAARAKLAAVKKNKRLKSAIIEGKDRAVTGPDGIIINPQQIIDEALAKGMTDEQAAEYFDRVLDEEIRHLAQFDAAKVLWQRAGQPGDFRAWMNLHYSDIWKSDFSGEKGDTVRDIYAGKDAKMLAQWAAMSDGNKALEAIRIMSQGDAVTEQARLWLNISDALKAALQMALAAMKRLKDVASPQILQEITNLENALRQITGVPKQDRAGPRNPQKVKADTGGNAETGQTPETAGAGPAGGVGGTDSLRREAPVSPVVVGSRVEFERDGVTLAGVVTFLKGDAARVKLDQPDAEGVPTRMANVKTLKVIEAAPVIQGEKINDEWTAFAPESGTIGIPRALMPQIHAGDRSALVQFLKARGVNYAEETVPASTLKPTQTEYSPAKVKQAKEFEGGNRSILVSSDNHVLDGHHQWLAALENSEDIAVIRLNAPIRELLPLAMQMPSVTVAGGEILDVPDVKPANDGENADVNETDFANTEATAPEVAPTLDQLNDPAWHAQRVIDEIDQWVGQLTGNGKRKIGDVFGPSEETRRVKMFLDRGDRIRGYATNAKAFGPEASFRIAINKARTFAELRAAAEKMLSKRKAEAEGKAFSEKLKQPRKTQKSPESNVTPTPTLTPEEEQAKNDPLSAIDDELAKGMEGLFAANLPDTYYKPIPQDRFAILNDVVGKYIAAGVNAPAKLAERLSGTLDGKLTPFSQSLWGLFKSSGVAGEWEPDWGKVYASLDRDTTIPAKPKPRKFDVNPVSDFLKEERDQRTNAERRQQWIGQQEDSTSANDIANSDWEKLMLDVDRGRRGMTLEKATAMVESAVENEIIDAKVGERMIAKIQPEPVEVVPANQPAGEAIPEPPVVETVTAPAAETKAAKAQKKAPSTAPKKLKAQKEYLLAALDKAIEEAPETNERGAWDSEQSGKDHENAASTPNVAIMEALFKKYGVALADESKPITWFDNRKPLREAIFEKHWVPSERPRIIEIEVPGDGTFRIVNDKRTLQDFRKNANTRFPTTVGNASLPTSTTPRETAITKIGEPKTNPEFIKIAGMFVSDDPQREVLHVVHMDGENVVGTNGRQVLVLKRHIGGSEEKPAHFNPGTMKPVKLEGVYPAWKQVIPREFTDEVSIDTAAVQKIAIQAKAIATKDDSEHTLLIFKDSAGKMGYVLENPEEGLFSGGDADPETSKFVTALDVFLFLDGLKAMRLLGHEKVKMKIAEPATVLEADGVQYVQAAMRFKEEVFHPLSVIGMQKQAERDAQAEAEKVKAEEAKAQGEAKEAERIAKIVGDQEPETPVVETPAPTAPLAVTDPRNPVTGGNDENTATGIPDLPVFAAEAVAQAESARIIGDLNAETMGEGARNITGGAKVDRPDTVKKVRAEAAKNGWSWDDVIEKARTQLGLNKDFVRDGSALQKLIDSKREDARKLREAKGAESPATPAEPAPKPKKIKGPTRMELLANYFTPGKVVDGYGGKDRVIEFKEDGDNFAVKVIRLDEDGARERWHSTMPSEKALAEAWKAKEEQSAAPTEAKPAPSVGRFSPKTLVEFKNPITGPSGAKLAAYEWKYRLEEGVDKRGEDSAVRVSNWEESQTNDETGREVVHQFHVEMPDGKTQVASLETALELLGYTAKNTNGSAIVKSLASVVKTRAKNQMELGPLEQESEKVAKWQDAYDNAHRNVDRRKMPEMTVDIDAQDQRAWGRGEFRLTRYFPGVMKNPADYELRQFEDRTREGWIDMEAKKVAGESPQTTRDLSEKVRDLKLRIKKADEKIAAITNQAKDESAPQEPAKAPATLPEFKSLPPADKGTTLRAAGLGEPLKTDSAEWRAMNKTERLAYLSKRKTMLQIASAINSTLSPEEKSAAAKELGETDWNDAARDTFMSRLTDWLVSGIESSAKLAAMFAKVAKNAALSVVAAISIANTTNTDAISVRSVADDMASMPTSSPQPMDLKPSIDKVKSAADSASKAVNVIRESLETRRTRSNVEIMADWVKSKGDNNGKPFAIADKQSGTIDFFNSGNILVRQVPALFGATQGDIKTREQLSLSIDTLRTTKTAQITQAGRIESRTTNDGDDYGDYLPLSANGSGGAISAIHRVFLGRPEESRQQRLDTENPADNRISLGCINVPAESMAEIAELFTNGGVVYILPETEDGKGLFEGFQGLRAAGLGETGDTFTRSVPVNKALAAEARAEREAFGKNVASPKLAGFDAPDSKTRAELDVVTAVYEYDKARQSNDEQLKVARAMYQKNPADIEAKLLDAVTEKTFLLTPADHLAVQMLLRDKIESAGGDMAKQAEFGSMLMAYRIMRGDAGRLLQIGRDRFLNRAQRDAAAIMDAIYEPTLKVRKVAMSKPMAERMAFIRKEVAAKLDKVEKALAGIGVTIAEATGKVQKLTEANSQLMREVQKLRNSLEQNILRMVQKGYSIADIRKRYGPDAAEQAQGVVDKARAELFTRIKEMAVAGMTMAQIREKLGPRAGLNAAGLGGSGAPTISDSDIWKLIETDFGLKKSIPEKAKLPRSARVPKATEIAGMTQAEIEEAERESVNKTAKAWLAKLAKSQSDTLAWGGKSQEDAMAKLIRAHIDKAIPDFIKQAEGLGAETRDAEIIDRESTEERRRIENIKNTKANNAKEAADAKIAANNTPEAIASRWIARFAKSQSDTQSLGKGKKADDVSKLIREHMKEPMTDFIAKAIALGMTERQAQILAAETAREKSILEQIKASRNMVRNNGNLLTSDWSRPQLLEGLKAYDFDAKDRAGIMSRVEAIRTLAHASGKIESLTGADRTKADALMSQINAILAKYGTDVAAIFEDGKPIEDYSFDINDVSQVAMVARTISAIDADIVDKASEWLYAGMLSGFQTMLVNATAIIPSAWETTVGRGVELALNTALRNPMGAQWGEEQYILKALKPAITRAMSNFHATWTSQHPMFERDVLGQDVDWERILGGKGYRTGGSISGKKGDVIRIPMRLLAATDDFNLTLFDGVNVATYAYRLAKAQDMKPGSPEFDKFMRKEVNTPGSMSHMIAATHGKSAIFSNALPGQVDPVTGQKVKVRDMGDIAGWAAASLSKFATQEHENLFAKAAFAALKISFFPFQRTPFNILRKGIRYTLNPFSLFDILGPGLWQTLRHDGKWSPKIEGNDEVAMERRMHRAELLQRAGTQLQGGVLMLGLAALAAGEGDDEDQDKRLLITGSAPYTPRGRGEREAQARSGIGPYRISFRRGDGSERVGFSYGRIEPMATTLAASIDLMKSVKRNAASGGTSYDAASEALGGMVAQVQDKSFMRGIGDLFGLMTNLLAEPDLQENRKFQQFLAGRVAMVIPNVIKQPIREADSVFRERSDSFLQEMLYQSAPIGQKPAKIDPYGNPAVKPGIAAVRPVDVTDSGSNKVNPVDRMLLRWRDSGAWNRLPDPGDRKPWFPSPIVSADYKHPVTGAQIKMNAEQLNEFRERAGKLADALIKREALNFENPRITDIEKVKKAITKARSQTKAALAHKFSRETQQK